MNGRKSAAWSVVVGLVAVFLLPVAIALTRYSGSYDLVHAGFGVPVVALLGFGSIALTRRSGTRGRGALLEAGRTNAARVGRALGVLAVCIASSATIALAVFGILLAVD